MRECRVWWAAPVDPAVAPWLVEQLDPLEQDRLARFRRAVDRARYLAAHGLARRVLGAALDVDPAALVIDRTCRCGEQHGKPRLADGPRQPVLQFSMTHAGDLVGVAVHDRPVGLDVEQARPLADLAGMAAHACSPDEPVPTVDGFFRLWTRKEALLKTTGRGLSSPMSGITLDGPRVVSWTGADAPSGEVWLADLSPAPDHPAAVAGLGAPPQVTECDGTPLLQR